MEDRKAEMEAKAKEVLKVATDAQRKIFDDWQSGDEWIFLFYLRAPITKESIDKTLQLIVNTVEGDITQLPDEHYKYAKKKGWLKGFGS